MLRLPRAARPGLVPLALGFFGAGGPAAQAPARAPNVVLIVLDDIGVDKVGAYHQNRPGWPPPCTPSLNRMAREGLLFRQAWTDPICSPSRAEILTGRYGFRTGIGKGVGATENLSLRVDLENMLPRVLVGHESSAVGKWHLMSYGDANESQPLDAGFGYYAGSLFNVGERTPPAEACRDRRPLSYTNWLKTYDADGNGRLRSVCSHDYATTDTANEAIVRGRLMRPPWFLYVAFNAAHWPLHDPPAELCPDGPDCARSYCTPQGSKERWIRQNAMVEALDTEIGRLRAALVASDANTVFLVIGDNGTDEVATPGEDEAEVQKGKGSISEGGLHVPLIAWGPLVVPGECGALVSSSDLYATVCELAGVSAPAEDSISLVPYLRGAREPLRKTVYAEVFNPNQPDARLGQPFAPAQHARALRDARYKLVRISDNGVEQEAFFDLAADPDEKTNLLAAGSGEPEQRLQGGARASYLELRKGLQALGRY